jgi:hypothetical protein
LSRHARDLELSLRSAGLELANNGLSFDLRRQSGGPATAGDPSTPVARDESHIDAPAELIAAARPVGIERWRGVRVDVRV